MQGVAFLFGADGGVLGGPRNFVEDVVVLAADDVPEVLLEAVANPLLGSNQVDIVDFLDFADYVVLLRQKQTVVVVRYYLPQRLQLKHHRVYGYRQRLRHFSRYRLLLLGS